jgi:tetratricopeptide (TPR) repeat protein
MALSYWGWQGDQTIPQAVLRPNPRVDDKNVMPAELAAYVQSQTGLHAIVRVGGDLDLIKSLIAAGFPVIVEKGHTTTGWIGHYILLTGYDDARGHFLSQDSLIVAPNQPVPYARLTERWWRHFNYLYLVIYPAEREPEIMAILGPHSEAVYNFQTAAEKARQEISQLQGRELFFAWYNLGSSLAGLGDYSGAAQAFDAAYADVYPSLSKQERPWRVLWYRTEPYLAYYSTGRYPEVITLANTTLTEMGKPIHEESLFWRGMAREALGDVDGATADYEKAARLNPRSTSALEQVQRLSSGAP